MVKMVSKSESAVGKAALWAIALNCLMRAGVDFTTLDAVENDLRALRIIGLFVLLLVIQPQGGKKKKACAKIHEKENIYFQADHIESGFNRS